MFVFLLNELLNIVAVYSSVNLLFQLYKSAIKDNQHFDMWDTVADYKYVVASVNKSDNSLIYKLCFA